jgi:glutathionyl-hydroquinone reductase
MGVLINGVWTEGEVPQEYTDGGRFKRAESQFRDTSLPTVPRALRQSPGAIISMSHMVAPGLTAH